MKEEVVYCGIDVAKEQLDVALGQERWRVPNTKEGIARLLKRFSGQRLKLHVICEASGGYEKAIVTALQKSALAVSLVQANRVRQFARAAGVLVWPCARLPALRSRSKSLVCANWMHSAGT